MKRKCKYCGKEFELSSWDNQIYCSKDCSYLYKLKYSALKNFLQKTAKEYDFELKNLEKIINAKMLMFGKGDLKRCPCLSQDPDHYCGSARYIADTVYLGHCCCRLFWSKKEPLLDEKKN